MILVRREFLLILFVALLTMVIYVFYGFPNSITFFVTNYIIVLICLIGIFQNSQEYYSLYKIFYLFSLILFGYVPYFNYVDNIVYWNGSPLDTFYCCLTNIIIIISLITYSGIYLMYKPNINTQYIIDKELAFQNKMISNVQKVNFMLLFISFLFVILFFYYKDFIFLNLLYRDVLPNVTSRIELVFVNFFIQPTIAVILLIYGYLYDVNKIRFSKKVLILLVILVLLFVFPTSMARFLSISIYFAFLLSFSNFLHKRYMIQLSSLVGLFVILPLLDKFRYFILLEEIDFSINFQFLEDGHFDAYQNFVRFVSSDYIGYGYQLLGVLSFFVPRIFWEDKPISTGHLLGQMYGLSLENISFPLMAEGYADFSVFGSILFMIIFAIGTKYLDKLYWDLKYTINNYWFFNLYHLLLGLSLYLLRGSLLSSFAYVVSTVLAYLIIIKSLRIVIKK